MLCEEVIKPEDFTEVSEFLKVLSRDNPKWESCNPRLKLRHITWIFRGQADSELPLIPLVLRQEIIPKYEHVFICAPRNNREQIRAEYWLIEEFRKLLDKQGLPIPEDSQGFRAGWRNEACKILDVLEGEGTWPSDEYLSLMALAQHHRIPTRLLDWSRDPYVAAYFAAKEAAMWVVGETIPPNKGVKNLSVWAFNTFFSDFYHNIDGTVRTVTAPAYGNPNLHAQKGLFTLVGPKLFSPNEKVHQYPFEEYIDDKVKEFKNKNEKLIPLPVIMKFTISIEKSREILRHLSKTFYINAATIYPGFDGAAEELKEQRLWDKT